MGATVAAALKKIAVALLTDPKVLKTVLGIVLGIIIFIVMPIVAVLSIFNGDMNIDTDRLHQMVAENLSSRRTGKAAECRNNYTLHRNGNDRRRVFRSKSKRSAGYLYPLRSPNTPMHRISFQSWWAVLRQNRQTTSSLPLSILPSEHSFPSMNSRML